MADTSDTTVTTATTTTTLSPQTVIVNQPTPAASAKPGYRCSEFYLTLIATVGGLLMASGVFPETTGWGKIIGLGLSALAAMGYTAQRTSHKNEVAGQ